MAGHLVEFAGDQLGSRHIQSKLDTASAEEKEIVFNEIYPNVLQLSMDVFAKYVCRSLLCSACSAAHTFPFLLATLFKSSSSKEISLKRLN